MNIKVRIAPSPTGYLHIGTARTALFNYFFAVKHGGRFVLRIEDTDVQRSDKRYEMDILAGLKWLSIDWDEGPFRQSDRTEYYKKYINQLLNEEKAFWCRHTEEELEQERKEQAEKKEIPRHVCSYKHKDFEKKESGVIRLAVDENSSRTIEFYDIVRGSVKIAESLLGDVSIAKDENTPLYNLAVVVDDFLGNISHVIRGEDHISNTPKQILIQEALGFTRPQYAHLPLILGPDRSKMSKRHGTVSVNEYKSQGYLPQAMANYISTLGFTLPEDREIMPVEDIIKIFDLDGVHKSGAVFDIKKLDWMNSQYIKKLSDEKLKEYVKKYLDKKYTPEVEKGLGMIRERITKYEDLEEFDFLYKDPETKKEDLVWKKGTPEDTKKALESVEKLLERFEPGVFGKTWSRFWGKNIYGGLRNELDKLAKNIFGGDRGAVYWPFRVALSGRKHSPDPIDILQSIGKEKALARIRRAVRMAV